MPGQSDIVNMWTIVHLSANFILIGEEKSNRISYICMLVVCLGLFWGPASVRENSIKYGKETLSFEIYSCGIQKTMGW
jgi:hypothetical protein